ncbi:MAG: heme-copper oxidase subunit III [Nitrospinota bacterium]
MSSNTATSHHEWETSWAPLVIAVGIFFTIPLAFSGYFQYESLGMAILFLGIGVPVLLAGIARWVTEGMAPHEGPHEIPKGLAISGLPIFITSEVFIFLGIFVSYWALRLSAESWPPEGTPHIGLAIPVIMTIILVSSSFTFHFAEHKLENGDHAGFKSLLLTTIALGVIFLGFTFYEYNHLLGGGFGPETNIYGSAFYSITGFHAAHVLVGVGTFIAVLIPALGGKTNMTFVKCAGVYWHFVDIVWFFVVSQIYFW